MERPERDEPELRAMPAEIPGQLTIADLLATCESTGMDALLVLAPRDPQERNDV